MKHSKYTRQPARLIKTSALGGAILLASCASMQGGGGGSNDSQADASRNSKTVKNVVLILPAVPQLRDKNDSTSAVQYAGFGTDYQFPESTAKLEALNEKLTVSEEGKSSTLAEFCEGKRLGAAESGIIAGIFSAIAGTLIKEVFKSDDKKITKALKNYQAVYEKQIILDASKTKCLRFVSGRIHTDSRAPAQQKFTADIDMVVQILPQKIIKQDGTFGAASSYQLVPRYVQTTKPRALGDSVGYAITAQTKTWMSRREITEIDSKEQLIAKGKFSPEPSDALPMIINNCPTLTDCRFGSVQVVQDLPIFPWTGDMASVLTFKVTEAGTGKNKKRLEDWQSFLATARDDISGAFSTAVDELID